MENTLIQSMALPTHNGIIAGRYEWHRTKEAAEAVALPGSKVVETSPDTIWRAMVERL